MSKLSVSKQFSSTPGGRMRVMGPDSGEEFRTLLVRELKRKPKEVLEVSLDGAEGYGSSFLEEAFGGIIRHRLLSVDDVLRRLKIVSDTELNRTYVVEAETYIREAVKRLNG